MKFNLKIFYKKQKAMRLRKKANDTRRLVQRELAGLNDDVVSPPRHRIKLRRNRVAS